MPLMYKIVFFVSRSLYSALCLLVLVVSTSCVEDAGSVDNEGVYGDGYLVVNEGSFGKTSGSLTHVPGGSIVPEAYKKENGVALGETLQSISEINVKYYACVSGANEVVVLNKNTLKREGSFSVNFPRYITPMSGTRLLVSSGFRSKKVKVLSLQSDKVTDSIEIGYNAEQMIKHANKIFIASSTFSGTSTIAVIDSEKESVDKIIDISNIGDTITAVNPAYLTIDNNFKLWALAVGSTSYDDSFNVTARTSGYLLRIDPDTYEIEEAFEFTNPEGTPAADIKQPTRMVLSSDREHLFYIFNSMIYKMSINDKELNISRPFLSRMPASSSGYHLSTHSNTLFVITYSQSGTVNLYSETTGSQISQHSAGGDFPNAIFHPL